MTIPILIRDIHLYGLAIVLTCSLGCSNIAAHIYSRWFSQHKINVMTIHAVIKILFVIIGAYFISWYGLMERPGWIQLICLFPAILVGIGAVQIELKINRWLLRKKNIKKDNFSKTYVLTRPLPNKVQGLAKKTITEKINLKNVHEHHARLDSEIKNYTLRDIIIVAISEEILFRGYLFQLCMSISWVELKIAASIFSVVLFGASHFTLGRGQFLSKTILGALCLLGIVLTRSLIVPITIHVVFNIFAYKEAYL